jgi:hypothetical protein
MTYGRGRGAKTVGQSSKIPEVGRLEQSLDPPPQLGMPESPMSDAPIIKITVPVVRKNNEVKLTANTRNIPVTMGGKIFFNVCGDTKDMNISRNEHINDVPAAKNPLKAQKVIV